MLRPVFRSFRVAIRDSRAFTSSSDDSSSDIRKKIDLVNNKDVVGENEIKAASDASKAVHPNDKNARKNMFTNLIGRLKEVSLESMQTSQQGILDEIAHTMKDIKVERPRAKIAIRHEVFTEAKQRGFSDKEAREISEKATLYAEEKLKIPEAKTKKDDEEKAIIEEDDKQQKLENEIQVFCEEALQKFEKTFEVQGFNQYGWARIINRTPIVPDSNKTNLFDVFDSTHDLKIFTNPNLKSSLPFWKQYNLDRARVVSKALGPRNAFEELIEWTEEGKLWPYPIDNEYKLGNELNVSFTEHIFLDKYLQRYNLPKTGPIAQFMEIVCVGLSKNPYMTVEKKRSHLDWFGEYFTKQVEKVHELHEKEKAAFEELEA